MGCLQSKTSNVQSPDAESLKGDKPDLRTRIPPVSSPLAYIFFIFFFDPC